MVELDLVDGLAVITINRPQARNAIALSTMGELEQALDKVADARALVITGAGDRAFVSGGDLKELAALRTEADAAEMAWRMRRVCDRIAEFPGPVVAALNGHALGGGAEVAVSADIRVAAAGTRIGFNQTALAIMPAWGGLERLVRLVGRGRAVWLAGAGVILPVEEVRQLGLVDLVLPRDEFESGWRALAGALATAPAQEIKRVAGGVSADEAVHAFARLWVAEAHWEAAERVMNRGR